MATSRPLRDGDFVISLRGGGWAIWRGQGRGGYVLGSDFGLPEWRYDYWVRVCERIYGLATDSDISAAITNGTAPGLYVREGDDTSNWEVYREVLARRVEEAMAARRGEASGGETAREDAAALAAARAMPTATTRQDPADVRKVSSPPQTVADVSGIEAAVSDEVQRRISSPLVSDETTRQRVVNPVPPAPAVDVRLQFGGERDTTASRIRQEVQRELDRQYGRIDASSSPSPPPTLPSPPSRFSLLEIDTDTDAKDASPSPSNAPVDLAAVQAELRAEREARRALAAAQTPPGRFDLLECDLPAVVVKTSTKATKTPQARPAASSPPRRPVETITDLTTARSPLELARMLEGLNDELSTMMRRREAN